MYLFVMFVCGINIRTGKDPEAFLFFIWLEHERSDCNNSHARQTPKNRFGSR